MNITFKSEKGLYSDLFVTCLLIVISFGLYLPWGITKLRKSIWSKLSLNGERFYYIGQAKELLMGYLFILGVYGVSKLIQFVMPSLFGKGPVFIGITSFIGSVVFFTLLLKSRLGSFRYQTHRTVFSGIRLSTDLRGPKDQYIMCFKWGIICALTLGLGLTYFIFKIDQLKYNSLRYGNEKFEFKMEVSEYFNLLFKSMLLFFFILIISFGALAAISYSLNTNFEMNLLPKTGENLENAIKGMVFVFIAGMVSLFTTSKFMADFFRKKCSYLRSQNIHFSTSVTTGRVLKYNILNLLIIFVTLGLGFPLVLVNNVKLFSETIAVKGMENLLVQNDSNSSESGKLESFDDLYAFDLDMFDAF